YRRARYLWPHRSIIKEGALAPLHHRFRIKIVAAGELLDRSLRSLYSSSDGVRGLGAAVKNLSHRASRNVASAWLIPRHSGTANLGGTTLPRDRRENAPIKQAGPGAMSSIALQLSRCWTTSSVVLLVTSTSVVFGEDPSPTVGKYSCSVDNIVGLQTNSQTGTRLAGRT